MKSVQPALDAFTTQENMYHFEGESGVRKLTKVVEALGYKDRYTGSLEAFLADNSGALEALLEWIGNQRSTEWVDSIKEHLHEPLVEDDDE